MTETADPRQRLSTLWIITLFTMVYADVLSFLDAEFLRGLMSGHAEGVPVTDLLRVAAAVALEVPILMVFLSRTLQRTANRRANLIAVPLTAAFVVAGGSASPHYLLLAGLELVFMALIVRDVWRWR